MQSREKRPACSSGLLCGGLDLLDAGRHDVFVHQRAVGRSR